MKVDVSEWHEFKFGKLIDYIGKAKALNKDDLNETKELSKGIRYITRTSENNGCELLANRNNIDEKYIQKGNAITVGDTTATCFYQKNPNLQKGDETNSFTIYDDTIDMF